MSIRTAFKSYKQTFKTDTRLKRMLTKPHTITALIVMLLTLIYLAFQEHRNHFLVGFVVCYFVFCLICLLQLSDSVFKRPHPAIWRVVKGTSIFYLMLLIFILFQDKDDVRQFLKRIDPSLGIKLPEQSYGAACALTYENVYNAMDLFVPAHIFGWYFKALLLRDTYLCWILSVLFEIMEYSLAHHLPNFNECWWDHWILDIGTCNALGIYLGIKTCKYFNTKMYYWRGKDHENEFAIFYWLKGADTFKKYIGILTIIFGVLAAEMNTFYLKTLLWLPAHHYLNLIRLIIYVAMGAVAIREGYAYFADKMCKSFGYQLWLCIAIICVETLISIKFGIGEFTEPAPLYVKIFWTVVAVFVVVFPIVKYWFLPMRKSKDVKMKVE